MQLSWRTRTRLKRLAFVTVLVCAFLTEQAQADRVKDIASVAGVRNNQLVGYGLVVGLNGTGDQTTQTPFTVQSIINMLTQFGVTIPPGVNLQLKNVAAVTVHAELPPFSKPGQKIDVTIAGPVTVGVINRVKANDRRYYVKSLIGAGPLTVDNIDVIPEPNSVALAFTSLLGLAALSRATRGPATTRPPFAGPKA